MFECYKTLKTEVENMKQSLALLNIMHARKEEEGAGEGEGGSPRL